MSEPTLATLLLLYSDVQQLFNEGGTKEATCLDGHLLAVRDLPVGLDPGAGNLGAGSNLEAVRIGVSAASACLQAPTRKATRTTLRSWKTEG